MYSVERVIRTINDVDKEVKMVFGTGRLTNNPPAIREVGANNTKLMQGSKDHQFSMAFPDPSLGRDEQNRPKPKFYNVSLWGKNAENMANLGFKGQSIEIVGRIDEHVSESDGKTYETLVIERFEVKQYKPRGDESSSANPQNTGGTTTQSNSSEPFDGRPIDISDDDIPF